MAKFGYPVTLINEYESWVVLLRPQQATLGALVLVCKEDAVSFAEISPAAFTELQRVVSDIETGLSTFRPFQKINYLMLMMVDPDVHFHVVPRYDVTQSFNGVDFPDPGWPAVPDLGTAVHSDSAMTADLVAAIQAAWPGLSAR